jgi:NADH:ubiquinone oxidoreductase subunit K
MSPATNAAYGVPLAAFLLVAAVLFCLGLFAALRRSNVILILMGIELMLNAVNLNLVAFSRFVGAAGGAARGQAFAIFVLVVAAAEAAVGLALAIVVSRRRGGIEVEQLDLLHD